MKNKMKAVNLNRKLIKQSNYRNNFRMLQKVKIWFRGDINSCGLGMVDRHRLRSLIIIVWKVGLRNLFKRFLLCTIRDILLLILLMLYLLFNMIEFWKGVRMLKKLCLGIFKIVISPKNMKEIFKNNLGNILLIFLLPIGIIHFVLKMKMIAQCGCLLFYI